MNIEKLAKHLKEFTLDEINMIAECNCKTELEHLLNEGKIVFEQGIYEYVEGEDIITFEIFVATDKNKQKISFKKAVDFFMNNYARKVCKQRTYETYDSIFRIHIVPYFQKRYLNTIENNDVVDFYKFLRKRNLSAYRLKNTMMQLNQLIRYFQNLGVIDKKCIFQVKRLTSKNEFSINRIIFEGD